MLRPYTLLKVLLAISLYLVAFAPHIHHASAQQAEVDVLVAEAILAYDDKQYDSALHSLNQALELKPRDFRALYYRGLVHLARKQPDLAIQDLEQANVVRPNDINTMYELGIAYFTVGEYGKAEPLLNTVFERKPDLEDLGYYVGFLRYRHKDYSAAVSAFDRGKSSDADIQQLTRFYKGLALGILGLSDRAIIELEEARRIQPASPITGAIERLRDTVSSTRPRLREQRLRAEIRLGAYYDDNVSVNPNPSEGLRQETLRLEARETPQPNLVEQLRSRFNRSPGMLIAPRVDYSFYRNGPMEATATYSFFQTLNFNRNLSEFNIQDHLGALAFFYRGTVGAMPYQVGLQYSYDYLLLGNAGFLSRHSPTLFGTLVENSGNLTTALLRFQDKDFLRDQLLLQNVGPEQNRDARNYLAGLLHVFRFAGDRHLLRIGYQYDYENAKGTDFTYSGHRVLAGGQVTLPVGDIRLRYDYEVHLRDYLFTNRFYDILFPSTAPNNVYRRDTEQFHFFRIEKPLPHNFTVSLEYQGTFNKSNVPLYDYDRNLYSLIVTWIY